MRAQKPKGGWRPLTMLETIAKGTEAPTVKRKQATRVQHPPGKVYSQMNLSGESGYDAAAEGLYLDTLVTEDATRHGRRLARASTLCSKLR